MTLKIGDIIIPGRVLAAPMTGVTDLPARRIAVRVSIIARDSSIQPSRAAALSIAYSPLT